MSARLRELRWGEALRIVAGAHPGDGARRRRLVILIESPAGQSLLEEGEPEQRS